MGLSLRENEYSYERERSELFENILVRWLYIS